MEESRWHFVLRLPVLADGSFVEPMTWLLRVDLVDEGGGGLFGAWGGVLVLTVGLFSRF